MAQSITVIKLGGTEGVDFSAICSDAAGLLAQGQKLVFVHGGSAEANSLGEALGRPPKFITSPSGYTSRYTNREPGNEYGIHCCKGCKKSAHCAGNFDQSVV